MARLLRLIVPIACFLIFQGAYAIDFHFSASNGGESVGMTDSYDVDDSVGVWSRSSASFDGVSMTDRKSLSGSGDANINHVMCGRGGGSDYVINYALETLGASCIDGSGSSTLTPGAGVASRSVSTTGSAWTTSELSGTQGGDFAGVGSRTYLADISASQSVATGGSVAATQKVEAQGVYAAAYGQGRDSKGSYAEDYAIVSDGSLDAYQQVKAATGGCVAATQKVEAQGYSSTAYGIGMDSKGSYVEDYANVYDGSLDVSQQVKAGNSATARQSAVIDGSFAYAYCEARNQDKNYVAHVDDYIYGNAYFEFEGEASVDDSEARAHQRSYAEGNVIWPWAYSTGKLEERFWSGTKSFESWAWTSDTGDDAIIVEL